MATYMISFIGHLSFCLSDKIKWLCFYYLILRNNSKRSQNKIHNLDIKAGIWSEVDFRKIEWRKKIMKYLFSHKCSCWFHTREPANLTSHCSCFHNILFAHYDLQYFFRKHQIYSRLTMQYHFTCLQVTLQG